MLKFNIGKWSSIKYQVNLAFESHDKWLKPTSDFCDD